MEKESLASNLESYSHHTIVDGQAIKWARDCKEGIIAMTAPDEKLPCQPADSECQKCAYLTPCNKISIPTKQLN